ncbi:PRC-barrel domain-containing protein [Paraburkholderia sp. DGU8]|uniref:PRC-barrel domain-containing protein n=1 Tax=Paraburkholderia sp. DGU8 TaxID=3161997 RepID=UPI003467CA8D
MKRNKEFGITFRSVVASITVCASLVFSVPLLAAPSPADNSAPQHPSRDLSAMPTMKPAQKCLSDLRSFDSQMRKKGYWLSGSSYGFGDGDGSPMYGYSSGEPDTSPPAMANAASGVHAQSDYRSVRPTYEIRTLLASANILARRGQQKDCESLLGTSRAIYNGYTNDVRNARDSIGRTSDWRIHQIAAAQPVTADSASFRSAQLIGTSVLSPQREDLGSVNDIVLSPQTGKIAYLVIGRGGLFGIDETYVPVPWTDFKATKGITLLVLDTTKGKMDSAPAVKENQFSVHGDFAQESQKVDSYWKANLTN